MQIFTKIERMCVLHSRLRWRRTKQWMVMDLSRVEKCSLYCLFFGAAMKFRTKNETEPKWRKRRKWKREAKKALPQNAFVCYSNSVHEYRNAVGIKKEQYKDNAYNITQQQIIFKSIWIWHQHKHIIHKRCITMNFICLGSEIERNKHCLDAGADERKIEAKKIWRKKNQRSITHEHSKIHISLCFASTSFDGFLSLSLSITRSASNYIVIRVVKHLLLDLIALLQCSFKRYLRCTFISLCVCVFILFLLFQPAIVKLSILCICVCVRVISFLLFLSRHSIHALFRFIHCNRWLFVRLFYRWINSIGILFVHYYYWIRSVIGSKLYNIRMFCVFSLVLHKRLTFKVMHCFA